MIVLDTHAWIWWLGDSEKIPVLTRKHIDEEANKNSIYISSISVWEIAMLVSKGRLELTMDVDEWVQKTESLPFIKYVPVNNRLALKSVNLPGTLHSDPADRIIVATALSLGAPLVTMDKKLHTYAHVETIW